jgi:hypothetical protein
MADSNGDDRQRLDVLVVTPAESANSRNVWTRIGVAFPNKLGSFNVKVYGMPVPVNQCYNFVLATPFERREGSQPRSGGDWQAARPRSAPPPRTDDDPWGPSR